MSHAALKNTVVVLIGWPPFGRLYFVLIQWGDIVAWIFSCKLENGWGYLKTRCVCVLKEVGIMKPKSVQMIMESRSLRVTHDTSFILNVQKEQHQQLQQQQQQQHWRMTWAKFVSHVSPAKHPGLPAHTCSHPVSQLGSQSVMKSAKDVNHCFQSIIPSHELLQLHLWCFCLSSLSFTLSSDERRSRRGSQAARVCFDVSLALPGKYLDFCHTI